MRFMDRIAVKDMALTGEGYLRVRAKLSRHGIQDYYGYEIGQEPPEKVFRIYRPADEVFSDEALASFRLKPVTDGHPFDGVTAETWTKEARGVIAEDVRRDGDHMVATLLITDADIANRIQRTGSVELSCGYDCDLDMTPGFTASAQTYDAVQRKIRGNHVAVVDRGRCGPTCATNADKATGSAKIVMLNTSRETGRNLREWAEGLGFNLTRTHGGRDIDAADFDFHTTLIATATRITLPTGEHEIAPFAVAPMSFGVLGKDDGVPVLNLDAGRLADLRRFYVQAYGAIPTFEDFKPHVSLSYAWSGAPALDGLSLPDFPLVFDRIIVDEFTPDTGCDAMPRLTDCPGESRCQCKRKTDEDQDMTKKTVTIDGKTLEVTAEVATVIDGLVAKLNAADAEGRAIKDAAAELRQVVEDHTAVKADEIATLKAKVADLEGKVPTADALDAMAEERASVIADARKIDINVETKGKSLSDIRKAAVAKVLGDKASTLDGKSDDYISARFESLVDAASNTPDPVANAMRKSDGKAAEPKGRAAYLDSLSNAWKGA